MELNPELVKQETRMKHFLRSNNYNPVNTALHICRYWKIRKSCFGDRWLLPLDQTGFGALSERDVKVLRMGMLVPLYRPSGGAVLLINNSRIPPEASPSCIARLAFYLDYVHGGHSSITYLHVVSSAASDVGFETGAESFQVLQLALPQTCGSNSYWYVCQTYEEGKEELIDYLGYKTKLTAEFHSKRSWERIAGNSFTCTLKLLESRGLERQCLPRCLGGDYDYNQFDDFVRMRLSIEGIMSSAPIHKNILTWTRPDSSRTQLALPQQEDRLVASAKKEAPMRTYKRRNQAIDKLKKESSSLEEKNRSLRHANYILESHLAQARLMAAIAESACDALPTTGQHNGAGLAVGLNHQVKKFQNDDLESISCDCPLSGLHHEMVFDGNDDPISCGDSRFEVLD